MADHFLIPLEGGTLWLAGIWVHWTTGVGDDGQPVSGAESPQCLQDNLLFPVHSEHGPFPRKEVSRQLKLVDTAEIFASRASQCVASILQVNRKS